MKMVKKILFGLVAVAAVLSLASCGVKDDPEGIIKGTAGNYSVNYTYDGDGEYRAYKSTGARHSGALVKITFAKEDVANAGNSKFGLIFGLKETKQGDKKIRDFYIVGKGANGDYYVSKYENVVDIQAENFGATTTATGTNPKETIISTGTSNGIHTGAIYGGDGEDKYAYIWYQVWTDGTIHVKIGDMEEDNVTAWKSISTDKDMKEQTPVFKTGAVSYTIDDAYPSWTGANDTAPQDYAAIYARVQGTKTLNGKVKFLKDFHEAEDIEEID